MSIPTDLLSGSPCASCGVTLVGPYCHACGQKRIATRISVREFLADIVKRVLRFDRAFLSTLARALRSPGALSSDYLAGRRRGILDPVHYYVSTVFFGFVVAALTGLLAPLMDRLSALNWLGAIGGIVVMRIVGVFLMGGMWQLMFRSGRHNLAETYVFALYGYGTIGVLWTFLPLIDLAVPMSLGESPMIVAAVCLALEAGYFTLGIRNYAQVPLFGAAWRVVLVFTLVYGGLYLLGGSSWYQYLLAPLPAD